MKQCPNCKTTYTDETLRFCLADGAALVSLTEPDPTVSFERNQVRVDVQREAAPESVSTVIAPPFSTPPPPPPEKKGANWAIIGVLSSLLILVLFGFAAFAGYIYFYQPTAKENPVAHENSPTPKISPATPAEDEELKKKVEALEKQLEDQKKQKTKSSPNPFPTEPANLPAPRTARANSPDDGFLALRSEPSSETGSRIAKIPHGASLTVINCPKPTNPGKIKGRWCQVNYNGQEGWAFDAYMVFD